MVRLDKSSLTRRALLGRSLAAGCSLAASPLMTPVTLAAAPWDMRLVVIILRGGMDGLDVVRPVGDPAFAAMRPTVLQSGQALTSDLDGFFALHPALSDLMPLWTAGDLGFVHAVSTPYRNKRSHFDGQDLLEAGTSSLGQVRDGWLNRLLQDIPGVTTRTAFALGDGDLKLLQGDAPVARWSPEAELPLSPQAERLAELVMHDDPLFLTALQEARDLSDHDGIAAIENGDSGTDAGMMRVPRRRGRDGHKRIATYAAEQLRAEARIVSFSLNGWDTHLRQSRTLPPALQRLSDVVLTLQAQCGADVWAKTAVVAMTEFGRTVRENGSRGTDHGTGGAMLVAGGAVKGGMIHGRWPGLDEADLYDRRDLMPTGDLRAAIGGILHGVSAVSRSTIETRVFPGADLNTAPWLLR